MSLDHVYIFSSREGVSRPAVLGFFKEKEEAMELARKRAFTLRSCLPAGTDSRIVKLSEEAIERKRTSDEIVDGYRVESLYPGWIYGHSEVVEGSFTVTRVSRFHKN